jgi:ABC-type arginine/histidine transport system permease subunit
MAGGWGGLPLVSTAAKEQPILRGSVYSIGGGDNNGCDSSMGMMKARGLLKSRRHIIG